MANKMKNVILAVALGIVSFSVFAQKKMTSEEFVLNDEWRLFETSKNGSKFYTKGVQFEDDKFDFWLKIEKPPLQECNLNKNPFMRSPIEEETCNILKNKKIEVSVTHEIISCKNRKSKSVGGVFYNYLGEVNDTIDEEEKWKEVYPDTVYEGIFATFCSSMKPKKK